VFILVFLIQWFSITWLINYYEREKITNNLINIKDKFYQLEILHGEKLGSLIDIYESSTDENKRMLNMNANLPLYNMFYVFDKENSLIYGNEWQAFFSYILSKELNKHFFLFKHVSNVYMVSYRQKYDRNNVLKYHYYYVSVYPEIDLTSTFYQIFSIESLKVSNEQKLRTLYQKLTDNKMVKDFEFITIDSSFKYGIFAQFDLNNKPVMFYISEYQREIYQFMSKFFFFYLAVLFISFLTLSIFSYRVISNKIFYAISILVEKMKSISLEPQKISPVSKKTHGEILEVYHYFNEMVDSINNYQNDLSKINELFERIQVGLFWLDYKKNIVQCNQTFINIFKIESPVGKHFNDIIDVDIDNFSWKNNKYEIASYIQTQNFLDLSISFYRDGEGENLEYFGIVNDITEELRQENIRKTLEMELIRINKLSEVGKRVQGIVHNLNSPLNSIIGFAKLIDEEYHDIAQISTFSNLYKDIHKIITNAQSMSYTIKNILYKTKDDSIAMAQPININELLKQELSFCQHDLFFKHNVVLTLNLANNLPDIFLVYSDISQIFQTLFNNAMEAMYNRTDNKLFITSFFDSDFVGFTIQDNGIGMREQVKQRIFETGYTTKILTDSSGFGIGLPLALSIIQKNKGKIEILSELDKGTKIIISFPLNDNITGEKR
jgi:signal transduction histidine kinase